MNGSNPHSSDAFEEPHDDAPRGDETEAREEMLDSVLEQTRHYLDSDSFHGVLTDYVRQQRLPSRFDFDNLCEMVRCVLSNTSIADLPMDCEECVVWIATCIYEDLPANERTERLWNSIVDRIQNSS